ncbi:MAG: ZIP family metal transporter [Steroidobacteraceae bacterium]|jgi:zinc and cadmium transporter|nr:ZIP family metal transporter [Steroidobacteraceae bacterium]
MFAPPSPDALWSIVGLTAAVGLASALVASVFVLLPDRLRRFAVPHLVSFATGALLGAALIGLLPSAIAGAGLWNGHKLGLALLAGLLLFFLLEKFVLWHHCHHEACDAHGASDAARTRASGPMLLAGDAAHNLLDGIVIASAYLTSPPLGVATAIAVFTHELPTEIGDVGVLLNSGMSRLRAIVLNLLVGLAAVVGAVIAYFVLAEARQWLPYALAFAAASLLYVAVADLIPGLHRKVDPKTSVQQVALILLGLLAIWLTQPGVPLGGTSRPF